MTHWEYVACERLHCNCGVWCAISVEWNSHGKNKLWIWDIKGVDKQFENLCSMTIWHRNVCECWTPFALDSIYYFCLYSTYPSTPFLNNWCKCNQKHTSLILVRQMPLCDLLSNNDALHWHMQYFFARFLFPYSTKQNKRKWKSKISDDI